MGFGCLTILGVLLIAAAVLLVLKPWAPDIEVADPGPGGSRVTQDGLLGNYYPASQRAPGVLVLGGSEGGLSTYADAMARDLRDRGYSALVVSYFGAPGQPDAMDALPLEMFDTALAYLAAQPQVVSDRLGIIGSSKGGEASLLVASRNPELKAVVGLVPSNVAWQGLDQQRPWRMMSIGSTWSVQGQPIPYLPYGEFRGGDLVEMYRAGLTALPQHQDAVIPVEKASAPILLVCGEADTLWPACDMSRDVQKRSAAAGGPDVTVLAYPGAGHLAGGPPLPPGSSFHGSLGSMGGTPEANQAARADGWPKILDYLQANLRGSEE